MTDFSERAEACRARITLTKGRIGETAQRDVVRRTEAVLLVHQLTLTAWAWTDKPLPS